MSDGVGGDTPLDLCIVGAGIAGTVAALRARELGLRFSLLESVAPLHRQRPLEEIDRASTVVVSRLPASASPLIADACLAAASQQGIAGWIAQLSERDVALELGAQVFAIELEQPGSVSDVRPEPGTLANVENLFRLRVVDRTSGRERRVRARNVILAMGHAEVGASSSSGSDRGLEAAGAVASPVLVIGSGQAAFDSVISLAGSKGRASDPHPVYWTPGFRDESPVEPAAPLEPGTGDRWLEALRRHCNIRTLSPTSNLREQTEVDGTVRIVAEFAASLRPGDSDHPLRLEFDPACVLRFDTREPTRPGGEAGSSQAGSGSRWPLLAGLPVRIERRDDASIPVVDPSGALSLAGLYLIGDACGSTRLVCEDFAAQTGTAAYRRESRDGTVECAASEAVQAVEAVACIGASRSTSAPSRFARGDVAGRVDSRWQIVPIRSDGSLGDPTPIVGEVFEIGRRGRDLAEPDDIHMADHHASLVREEGEYFLADSGRGSGVWMRIDEQQGWRLDNEDQIWLGSQILVASREGDAWALVHYGEDGRPRDTHRVNQGEVTVGRDADISLVRDDALLSRRHARFRLEGEFFEVFDCGARNGTFVKVTSAEPLADGAEFRLATRGYRFEAIR